jgi:rubrerythrin
MTGLDFAIKMELDGEKYYLEQAEKNQSNRLNTVFKMLAAEEKNHAELLKNKAENLPYVLYNTYSEYKNLFQEVGDYQNIIKDIPDALDLYQKSLEMEKESIALYRDFLAKASDDNDKELFQYIIEQEEDHVALLDNLTELLNRPNDWVESAEFGLRTEY